MKTPRLLGLSALLVLSSLALGCSAASSAEEEDVSQDESELRRGWVDGDCTRSIDVPVNAQTLRIDTFGTVLFDWKGMATYSKLPAAPRLSWEVPPRDGESCDDSCVSDVIARAASRGGKLHGTLRVHRFTDVRQERDGTCHAYHRQILELDLRKATHGIRPDWEDLYDFLQLETDGEVDVGPTTCPSR